MILCNNCVLDNFSVPDITFDDSGMCNYCNNFYKVISKNWYPNKEGEKKFNQILNQIKKDGKNKEYDCIIGLSGGIDSSYLTLKAKDWGLRPLVVHVDAGWNSELAVSNIEKIIKHTGFDLHTEVIDWDVMRRLQLAYLKSGVSNQDVPQDHIFFSTLYKYSTKNKINYSISGGNISTESILPDVWLGPAMDAISLKEIFKKFGEGSLKNYRTISFFQYYFWYPFVNKLTTIRPLNYMPYNKEIAKIELEKIGFKNYKGKHGESIFTKFFQEYYLPKKFKIDKRKAHLSSLILSNQITREEALKELKELPYDPKKINEIIEFICKKLEITQSEFEKLLKIPNRKYEDYKNWTNRRKILTTLNTIYKNITGKKIKIYS
jgi:N-acetyl sugar amidotransferase